MTSLSTHVLDTAHGRPAAGMAVRLLAGDTWLASGTTDSDGRCPSLTQGRDLGPGRYALAFEVAAYFRAAGVDLPEPPFLDTVTIAFGIAEDKAEPDGHYHVPLLVSAFAYSTYRGS